MGENTKKTGELPSGAQWSIIRIERSADSYQIDLKVQGKEGEASHKIGFVVEENKGRLIIHGTNEMFNTPDDFVNKKVDESRVVDYYKQILDSATQEKKGFLKKFLERTKGKKK